VKKRKIVKLLLSVFLIVFWILTGLPKVFGFSFGVRKALADTHTSVAGGGAWDTPATWSPAQVPATTDDVIISGSSVTTAGPQTCASIVITGTLTMAAGNTLTVDGNVSGGGVWAVGTTTTSNRTISLTGNWSFNGTATGSKAAVANFTGTNAQTLSGTIPKPSTSGGTATLVVNKTAGSVTLGSTMTVDVFTNTAGTFDPATYLLTAATTRTFTAGTLRVGATTWAGNYSGTITEPAAGIIEYYAAGNQTVNNVSLGGSLLISGSGTKTMTLTVARTIATNLTVSTGTAFTIAGNFTFGVTGTTSVTGSFNLGGTSAKTFTGNVTIGSGGVWNETGVAAINYAGNLQNDGTTFTANTGVHTFTVTGKTISGASTIAIPNLTIGTGVSTTNNGTLTVSTALAGVTLVNGATGILNLGGTFAITTLTATTVGNTVNYTGTGQTLKVIAYHNLTLSGGAETFGAIITIAGNLTLSGSATATTGAVITLGGNIIIGTGTTLTIGANIAVNGGNITVTSTGALASSGTPAITMGAPGTISGNGNVTIYDLTISASGTTVLSATGTNLITHNVTVNAASTLDIQQSVTVTGGMTTAGTGAIDSTLGTPTVTVSGTAIGGGSGNITFFNLTKNGAGTTTWTNATTNTIDNNLTISAGTFVAPAGTLSIGGNYSNSGVFTHSSGTITLNGSGQQMLSGTLTGATGQFYNLTITNSSGSITATCPTTSSFTPGVIFGGSVTVTNNYNIDTSGLGAGVYVRYNSGSTYIFNNVSWAGILAKKIYFRNSNLTTGSWVLNVTGTQNISYIDVASSNAGGYPQIKAYVTGTSTDCGSGSTVNTNWLFSAIISVTVTSTANNPFDYGIIPFSGSKNTVQLGKTQTAQNSGNIAEDFNIKTSNATGGTQWSLGASPGSNVFVHEYSINGDSNWTNFTTANVYELTPLVTNVAVNGNQNFDLRITVPSSTTDYQQKTVVVTIQAVQHN
jgi:hypothetical protein